MFLHGRRDSTALVAIVNVCGLSHTAFDALPSTEDDSDVDVDVDWKNIVQKEITQIASQSNLATYEIPLAIHVDHSSGPWSAANGCLTSSMKKSRETLLMKYQMILEALHQPFLVGKA